MENYEINPIIPALFLTGVIIGVIMLISVVIVHRRSPEKQRIVTEAPRSSVEFQSASGTTRNARASCGAPLESDYVVCPMCKTPVKVPMCSNCGRELRSEFKACPYCGQEQ
ncbi:MAG: zinc ribbon domain-containing protein [Methanomassiliicoccales archaeon]|jgi:hypothetical protein